MTGRYEGKLSDLPVRLVRSCDGCGGTLLLDPSWEPRIRESEKGFGGPYVLCRSCQAAEDKREAAAPVRVNARCRHREYRTGPFSDLFVVSVESRDYTVTLADGDHLVRVPPLVTVGVLGLGGVPPERQQEILRRNWPLHLLDSGMKFPRNHLYMQGF